MNTAPMFDPEILNEVISLVVEKMESHKKRCESIAASIEQPVTQNKLRLSFQKFYNHYQLLCNELIATANLMIQYDELRDKDLEFFKAFSDEIKDKKNAEALYADYANLIKGINEKYTAFYEFLDMLFTSNYKDLFAIQFSRREPAGFIADLIQINEQFLEKIEFINSHVFQLKAFIDSFQYSRILIKRLKTKVKQSD